MLEKMVQNPPERSCQAQVGICHGIAQAVFIWCGNGAMVNLGVCNGNVAAPEGAVLVGKSAL